jgi:ABC-type oligopeptide transport system ATPase subunit
MANGQIVESGDLEQVLTDPQHMETKNLLASVKVTELKLAAGAPS